MEEIRDILAEIVGKVFGVSDVKVEVSAVPEGREGDYASNVAMRLTKSVGKPPREIAQEIAEAVRERGLEVQVAGPGFLNIILPDGYFVEKLTGFCTNFEGNISCGEYSGKKVICEFSDPNPFKVLHVGHLYTSMVGDAISRLIEFAGGEVVRANFGGDVGLHVAKNLYAVMRLDNPEITPELLSKCYVEGTRAYEEDEQAKAEITELNKEIFAICAENRHDSDLAETYWKGREVSYQYFKDFYARVGVKFDKFYPESTVAERGLSEVKGHPQVYVESDGALVFKGEDYGLHTRVFVNREGLPTYEAKDVGLIFTKWDDYHFDESIVITGNEQREYMRVVLKSVEQYAPELVEKTKHLTHGLVKLPGNQKMSSRKGNFLKAVDVLDEVEKLVGESGAKGDNLRKISLGAIRYAFLKYRLGGDFDFDAKESVSTTGNSGVYLQYSTVRAKKILAKCKQGWEDARDTAVEMLPEERKLAQKVVEYPSVLDEAVKELAPHKVANYLYELAQCFSKFYEKVKVAGSKREAELVLVVSAYEKVMNHGMELIGMEVPEEM